MNRHVSDPSPVEFYEYVAVEDGGPGPERLREFLKRSGRYRCLVCGETPDLIRAVVNTNPDTQLRRLLAAPGRPRAAAFGLCGGHSGPDFHVAIAARILEEADRQAAALDRN